MKYADCNFHRVAVFAGALVAATFTLGGCQILTSSKTNASSAATAEIPPAAETAFANAVAAQRAQQWADAEQQFQQLAEKYPQLSGPQLNLALLYAQTQKPELAETHFKRAMQINPANLAIYDQYGIWLRGQARFTESETIYQQALARDANRPDTHLNLAILYDIYMGKLPQALEHYQRYLELTHDEKSPVQGWVTELQRRMKAAG